MMQGGALYWWIAAAALVALELGSGSFYLLMLAVGAASAALAAHLGLDPAWQAGSAAVVGAGLVLLLYRLRRRREPDDVRNRDLALDIGAEIDVAGWDDEGRARVRWRGSDWDARSSGGQPPQPGPHIIIGLDGNTLLLQPQHGAQAHATQI